MTPQLSWDDARTACPNEGHGMQFATFKTREALQFIEAKYWNPADGGVLHFTLHLSSNFKLNWIHSRDFHYAANLGDVSGIIDIFTAVD